MTDYYDNEDGYKLWISDIENIKLGSKEAFLIKIISPGTLERNYIYACEVRANSSSSMKCTLSTSASAPNLIRRGTIVSLNPSSAFCTMTSAGVALYPPGNASPVDTQLT